MKAKKKTVDLSNSVIVKRPDYVEALTQIQSEGFCPFCEGNLLKHHKKPILQKGTHWIVTHNNWPYKGSKFHFLFIARKHIENIESLSGPAWTELHSHLKFLTQTFKLRGGTLMMRSGETTLTGATVNHLHGHFIVGSPRKTGSTEIRAIVGFEKK